MQLKRLYDHTAPTERWTKVLTDCGKCQGGVRINAARTGVEPCPHCTKGIIEKLVPPVRGVKILHAGPTQHFSTGVIEQGVTQGWLSLGAGTITVHGDGGQRVVYRIQRAPGSYCCHCGRPLDDEPTAKAHVAEQHAGAESPDPCNPAGYRRDNFFACVKEG